MVRSAVTGIGQASLGGAGYQVLNRAWTFGALRAFDCFARLPR